jgi:hypothetical protein
MDRNLFGRRLFTRRAVTTCPTGKDGVIGTSSKSSGNLLDDAIAATSPTRPIPAGRCRRSRAVAVVAV